MGTTISKGSRAVQLDNNLAAYAALVGFVAGGSEGHADGVDYGHVRFRCVPIAQADREFSESQGEGLIVFVILILDGGKYEGLLRIAGDEVQAGGYARVVARGQPGPIRGGQRDADSPLRVGAQNHFDGCGASLPDAVGGLPEADGYIGAFTYGDTLVIAFATAIGVDNAHHRLIRCPFAYSAWQPTEGKFDRLVVVVLVVVRCLKVKCLLGVASV